MKHKNIIKIIAGKFKGIKINIIKNKNIKPTLYIIRKTLFDWLNPYIKGFVCLDCFAGSGILSLEAISRKAKHVTLIEKKYKISQNIIKNFQKIKIKNYSVININIYTWLKKNKKKFNLIFIDPPHKEKNINNIIKLIVNNNLLKKKSFIYIETYRKNKSINIPKNWILYRKKKTQSLKYKLFIKKN